MVQALITLKAMGKEQACNSLNCKENSGVLKPGKEENL